MDEARSSIPLLFGVPALISSAYTGAEFGFSGTSHVGPAAAAAMLAGDSAGALYDAFARFAWLLACGFYLLVALLAGRRFFGQHRWEVTYLAAPVSFAAMNIAANVYYVDFRLGVVPSDDAGDGGAGDSTSSSSLLFDSLGNTTSSFVFPEGPAVVASNLVYLTLAVSTFVAFLSALQFALAVVERRVFNREDKWGPLDFVRSQHVAFATVLARLHACAALALEKPSGPAVDELNKWFAGFKLAYDAHSRQESDVIFPAYNEFFPGMAA